MGAEGSQSGISIRKESVFGVIDAGQFQSINFESEDLVCNIEGKSSNNVRPDGQTADFKQVSKGTEGGIQTVLQATNADYILPSFLWTDDWISPGTIANTTNFAVETGAGVGGKITFNALDTIDIAKDQFIIIESETANALNTGIFLVLGVVGKVVQVNSPLFTETGITDVVLKGDRIRNGVIKTSYSIERANYDVSVFNVFKGQVPSTLEVVIESGEDVKVNFGFIGQDDEPGTVTASNPAPTELSILPTLNASSNVGGIYVNDEPLASCLLQKIDFMFDKKAEGKKAVGSISNCNVVGKSISLTGNISLYFSDNSEYLKYKNATGFSFDINFYDEYGNIYIIKLANCKYNNLKSNITGKDDSIMLEGPFTCIIGENNYMLQIIRALA